MRSFDEVLREVVYYSDEAPEVKGLAAAMGRAPSTVYDYLEGRRAVPLELLGQCYVGTGRDRRVLAEILDPVGVGFFDLPRSSGQPLEHLLDLAIRAQEELVDVLREVRQALEDKRVDLAERGRIVREISETHSALAVLQVAVEREAR